MNWEKINDIEEKVRKYRWLKGIAEQYEEMAEKIERQKDYFKIIGITYENRGESRFSFNPHRPISCTFILDGINDALDGVRKEIDELEQEIERLVG